MADAQRQHFFSLLHDFKFGMLATHARNGELHSRPMVIAKVDDDGDLWLVTDVNSEKVEELGEDARLSLALQDGQRFVALAGKGEIVRDADKVHSLWDEAWRSWFPSGADDPLLVLLKIRAVHGEYWDNSGTSRVKYFFETAKAYLTGERPSFDDSNQGKVELTH